MALSILSQSYHLSKEEIEEFRLSFNMFDQDGNGRISPKELMEVMKKLGQNPSESEINELILELDLDNSGGIDFSEFLSMYAKKKKVSKKKEEKEILAAFKTFDRNGDGMISGAELKHVMKCLGENLSDSDVQDMIKAADIDGNGEIDYAEFTKVILSQKEAHEDTKQKKKDKKKKGFKL